MAMALAVGDRVQDGDGARGTVRYVGPVATSKDAAAVYYGACRCSVCGARRPGLP